MQLLTGGNLKALLKLRFPPEWISIVPFVFSNLYRLIAILRPADGTKLSQDLYSTGQLLAAKLNGQKWPE